MESSESVQWYLVEDEGFDALAKVVCDYVDRTYPDKNFTFKVDARRARKNYPMTSMEINAAVGRKDIWKHFHKPVWMCIIRK